MAIARDRFPIGARCGLIYPEHVAAMGEAVWLFLLLVDWQTDDQGYVLGGEPIQLKRISLRLGKNERTVQRWMKTLAGSNGGEKAYITTSRHPRGLVIRVLNQKKWLPKGGS